MEMHHADSLVISPILIPENGMQTKLGSITEIPKKVPTSAVTVTKLPLPQNPGHQALHLGRRMETRYSQKARLKAFS